MEPLLDDLTREWKVVEKYFKSPSSTVSIKRFLGSEMAEALENEEYQNPNTKEFHDAVNVIHMNGLAHVIKEWFFHTFEEDLHNSIIPKVWSYFQDSSNETFWKFPRALDELYIRLKRYYPVLIELQKIHNDLVEQADNLSERAQYYVKYHQHPIEDTFYELARALLLSKWPVGFRAALVFYYYTTFKAFQAKQKGSGDEEERETLLHCPGCDSEADSCCCQEYLFTFSAVSKNLLELRLLEHVIGDIPINVAHDVVEQFIQHTCKGNFEVPYLNLLRKWLDETVLVWLSDVYLEKSNEDPSTKTLLEGYKERLLNVLYEAYAEVRLEQLFNIIIEFPESQAALEDLRECIQITGLRSKLISSLKASLETRLLHPGVNTADILTAYISAIKALRVLDSSGVVLQVVCEPVCKYLRSREDTVRCIVSSLTDDSCGELASELMKGVPLMLEDSYHSDEEIEDWETWTPDPVDADPAKTTKSQRSSDIISMLVNIYGSKELFVNEYRTLLADRLLTTFSYNTVRENRYLELLKLRFGESQLHYCEVMLKDVADSKRINSHLNSGEVPNYSNGDFPVNTMILSAQFWPAFREEKVKLPEYMWEHLKKYTAAFETLKGNRTLAWKPHLGIVNIDIELKERTLTLDVSPVHAAILWHFQDKPQWTITELSNVMQIQASVLRRKITFWQSHGILKEEETDVFLLIEEQKGNSHESVVVIEEETESVTASSQDQREEELQTFWSFIVGMLTNMESLPLERIHSMLRMFAIPGPNANECSIQGMKQFLETKVRERKLLYSGGLYRLPRYES